MDKNKKWKQPEIEYERIGGMEGLILALANGKKPVTDEEKRLFKQMEELKRQGKTLDLPFE